MFGALVEASPDVQELLASITAAGATAHSIQMQATSAAEARGALAWMLKRRWGVLAARENARLILARLCLVGRGALQASRRRAEAEGEEARALVRHVRSCAAVVIADILKTC